eukprot:SAG11_NODE_508_length_8874_cov_5.205812_7_plen_205_part_00
MLCFRRHDWLHRDGSSAPQRKHLLMRTGKLSCCCRCRCSGRSLSSEWRNSTSWRRRILAATPRRNCATTSSSRSHSSAQQWRAFRQVWIAFVCAYKNAQKCPKMLKNCVSLDTIASLHLQSISLCRPAAASLISRLCADDLEVEKRELDEFCKAVPRPEKIAIVDKLTPQVICQQFRANIPVRMLDSSTISEICCNRRRCHQLS